MEAGEICQNGAQVMKKIEDARHEDIRAARAFAEKIGDSALPVEFHGCDELGTRTVSAGKETPADRKALEAEGWYQDWLKRKVFT